MNKEAMKLALEALYLAVRMEPSDSIHECPEMFQGAITALRNELAKQEQGEPLAFRQFLSDVHTAAGLVTHGKQSKALGERLGEKVMEYLAATASPVALAKQEQGEPVAYLNPDDVCADTAFRWCKIDEFTKPVYTTPQQRKPLTDEEIEKCYETTRHYQTLRPQDRFAVFALARAIEAAHGIKE